MEWAPVASIMRRLAGDDALARDVVSAVRGGVPEIAALDFADVGEHARAFVTAGLEAVAERRGPSAAELRFVERLASTRAGQGVPVTAMLAGIFGGQEIVWSRAAELFVRNSVPVELVVEVLLSHLAWAHAVQERAIDAHRRAELEAATRERDRRAELLRALLAGPVRPQHLEELRVVGFTALDRLWVVRAAADGGAALDGLALAGPQLSGRFDRDFVALVEQAPAGGSPPVPVALAGPAAAAELPDAGRLAGRVLHAAQRAGRAGIRMAADTAFDVVLAEQPELSGELGRSWFAALDPVDRRARSLVDTLLAHLDSGERLEATAAALFVHPNTVRYRLRRLQELTGVSLPTDMDGRVRLWWAARAWRGT